MKNKQGAPAKKAVAQTHTQQATLTGPEMTVRRPLLWLLLAALAVYLPALSFGLTDFDDGIFIHTFSDYNEDASNMLAAFQRGLFDAVKDTYYRPIFSDVMILNYQVSNHGENIAVYHLVNIVLHMCSVALLYKLFIRLRLKELHAFLLTLIFAVHPVLSMAVAWIPGRNDTMLAICMLSFLLCTIDYSQRGQLRSLLFGGLALLTGYFTKETMITAIPVAVILMVVVLKEDWRSRRNITQYAVWATCLAVWMIARMNATVKTDYFAPAKMAHDFVRKLPLLVQYTGKIFLPFNLSVYPMQRETVYHYGIAAILLLVVLVVLNKERNGRMILAGVSIFFLLLAPALIVPDYLNLQAFEHRLYVPIIGMLLLLSQTVFFQRAKDKALLTGGIAVVLLLGVLNFFHQKNFSDPLSFWKQAVKTSPHSAYANMMLAARIGDPQQSDSLFLKAYQLDPNEKYLNFIYGFMLQSKDSVLASEKYFLAEKKNTGFYPCDFYLARVAMTKNDLTGAIGYLENFLKKEPKHAFANNNLVFLYIDTRQPEKAKAQAQKMQQLGIEVSKEIRKELNL